MTTTRRSSRGVVLCFFAPIRTIRTNRADRAVGCHKTTHSRGLRGWITSLELDVQCIRRQRAGRAVGGCGMQPGTCQARQSAIWQADARCCWPNYVIRGVVYPPFASLPPAVYFVCTVHSKSKKVSPMKVPTPRYPYTVAWNGAGNKREQAGLPQATCLTTVEKRAPTSIPRRRTLESEPRLCNSGYIPRGPQHWTRKTNLHGTLLIRRGIVYIWPTAIIPPSRPPLACEPCESHALDKNAEIRDIFVLFSLATLPKS
jgi:hypothetical protein